MTVNTSRILTLDQKIPQAQVNNPDILDLTPLSPDQVQVSAKKPGVTQVNLWGEDSKIYTIDVIVYGDAQELAMLLQAQFPNAALKVMPVASGVLISGFVDKPEHIDRIVRIAEEYYPKVINNMTVGGVQQVLLHVKVMEVSRTKLRTAGLRLQPRLPPPAAASFRLRRASCRRSGARHRRSTVAFDVNGNSTFFGVLEALRQDNLLKILAEPTLVTVSGRPAFFKVGGEIRLRRVPQSLGTVSDRVEEIRHPGRLRAHRAGQRQDPPGSPPASQRDRPRQSTRRRHDVPALRTRTADTGVELKAGQTLAIAGLVQTASRPRTAACPGSAKCPTSARSFRRVEEKQQRSRTVDPGHAGIGRGDGRQRSAAVRPGHAARPARATGNCT